MTPITQPGIYQIPLADYIRDPAPAPSLNATTAYRLLEQSPRHAWLHHARLNPSAPIETTSRLEFGTAVHALLLEDDQSRIVVVEAEDWRTKAAKEARARSRGEGRIPCLAKDVRRAQQMVDAAHEAIRSSEFAEDFAQAIPEQTLIWEHEGVWCRSRPDKATKDWRILFDYKTVAVSAHPLTFARTIIQQGYDLQAQLALMGTERLIGPGPRTFVFIVQEIDEPYACSLVSLSPAWQGIANARLHLALSLWKSCLRKKEWPGYPATVAYLDPPAWYGQTDTLSFDEIDAEDLI